jgi:acyl-homoserine lactone acylase PvdQ
MALLAVLGASGASAPRDYASQAWNVLPPGENGGLTFDRNTRDQAKLYDGLTPLRGQVTQKEIQRWFKRAPLGVGGKPAKVQRLRKGVTIERDAYGVPHVTGTTEADVAYGAGWATAEDRGLLLNLIRGPARVAALDVPGLDPLRLALSGKTFVPSLEAEAFLANQMDALRRGGQTGRRMAVVVNAYAAGVNGYYASKGLPAQPFTANDVIASAALIAARFGANGGREAQNSMFLAALRSRLGDAKGDAVFADLRRANDPEAPVSLPGSFPQELPSQAAPGSVVLDDGSFTEPQPFQPAFASNALLVGAKRSATGHPVFVAGPQVGYFFPQFFAEVDLAGAGFAARGALFPGVPFVLIGRGQDFAWSATSSQADNIDLFVETLCNGDDRHYVFRGQCLPMRRFVAGVLKENGKPDQPIAFHESAHGPIVGYATVKGTRVAIAMQRSTRGRELLSAEAFYALNTGKVTSASSFLKTMAKVEFSFNWFYADERDIALFSSGRLPVRAPGTDPALPTVGTGAYDWKGFLTPAQHAQGTNPPSGVILSWNNKPARNVGSADSNFSYGSVQRVDLFTPKIAKAKQHTLASVVSVMNEAATQDLRVIKVWPVIRAALAGSPPPTSRADAAAKLVDAWLAAGGSRIDAALDGKVDDPGAAVLDTAWGPLTEAVMAPVLGPLTTRLEQLMPRDDAAGPGGSAYIEGWYGYIDKDLRTLLGRPVQGPFSTRYCGSGDLGACRAALWAALDQAAAKLEQGQGADPAAWRSDAARERIDFTTGILPDTMRWTNRPTFQQLMSFEAHRPR